MNDIDICRKIIAGEKQLFKTLVDRYEVAVKTVISGILGSDQSAVDDVAQESFVRLYKNLERYKGEASLKTYLIRIAINQAINHLNKEKRKNNIFEITGREIPPSENGTTQLDLREWLLKGLDELEPRFREIIVLRMVEGYSTEETAEILGIPVGTVGSRLNRAQLKLKEILLELDRIYEIEK
jgi:RNA polymerase sigma-70 factor (ECF subfamily)